MRKVRIFSVRFIALVGLMSLLCLMLIESCCVPKLRYPEEKNLSKVVVGYYPSWQRKTFDHTRINFKLLTHLAHAFAKPDSDGNLIVSEDYLYPELNRAAHSNNVKVMLSLGGWKNSEGFPGMASTSENRQRFIGQVLSFCRENRYDGVDIDWEYVSNPTEKQNFVLLIREFSSVLRAQIPPLLLTVAAPAGDFWAKWISFEELVECFDYISCMTYDYHGQWSEHSGHNSPLYASNADPCGSVDDSFTYFLQRRVPREKLLLGIPFYGRSFDCSDLYQKFQKSNYYGYREILNFLNSGWLHRWDNLAKVPYIQNSYQTEILSFDDAQSIALKCDYILGKDVAGCIIWALSEDDDSSSLLKVIGEKFK